MRIPIANDELFYLERSSLKEEIFMAWYRSSSPFHKNEVVVTWKYLLDNYEHLYGYYFKQKKNKQK